MNNASEDFLDVPLEEVVNYANRVRVLLRGAREMGKGLPRGIDFLRADIPCGDESEATFYTPVSEMKDNSIRVFQTMPDGTVVSFTITQPLSDESSPPDVENDMVYGPVSASKAALYFDSIDLPQALHNGVSAMVAWTDWLRPYLEEVIGRKAPCHMLPAAYAGPEYGIVVTDGDLQSQSVFHPDGNILNVGQAGLMVDPTGRVAPSEEVDVPEPIRDRIEEVSEKERERVAEMEAEAARRAFAE